MTSPSFDGSTNDSVPTATTFDAPGAAHRSDGTPVAPTASPASTAAADSGGMSMLDQLRARVDEREREEVEPWVHEIPKIGVKIKCDPRIDNVDYQRWMRQALPRTPGRGRRSQPGPMDMDQLQLSARAIIGSNTSVELYSQRTKEWRAITDGANNVLTLDDKELTSAFGMPDPIECLKKMFGRDSELIDAGQALLAAAGYLESDDEADPLG